MTGNENQALIKGLKPVTQYQVRVYAQNALGRGESSEQALFRTDEELPSGAPLSVKGTPISSSIIKLSWNAPKKELQNGLITGYYVGYKVKSSNEPYQYKTISAKVGEFNHEFQIKNLKRSSTYSITVQAMNSKGAGAASEEISIQTHENGRRFCFCIFVLAFCSCSILLLIILIIKLINFRKCLHLDPPLAPTLKVISSSSSTIQVTWHIDDPTKGSSDEAGQSKSTVDSNQTASNSAATATAANTGLPTIAYVLHFKLQNSDIADYQELRLPGDRSSYLFENLRCGSKYQFYIYAINAVDKGDTSEVITGKTEGMGM